MNARKKEFKFNSKAFVLFDKKKFMFSILKQHQKKIWFYTETNHRITFTWLHGCYWCSFLSPEKLFCHFGFFLRSLFNFELFMFITFLLCIKFIQRNEWKSWKQNTDIAYSHDGTLKCNGNIPIGIFLECFFFLLWMTVSKNENWTTTNQKHVCSILFSCAGSR